MSSKFYPESSPVSNPYYSSATTEPSMRDELIRMFDGVWPEVPKKQPTVLRKMRRDSNGNTTQCPCVDKITREPDVDTRCPICAGEGFIWDEILIDAYKIVLEGDTGEASRESLITPGLINIPLVVFYTTYDVAVVLEENNEVKDKVVELMLDTEGNPILPYKREALYRIGAAIDFRSDQGRLEYWKLTCYKEKRKFLNG